MRGNLSENGLRPVFALIRKQGSPLPGFAPSGAIKSGNRYAIAVKTRDMRVGFYTNRRRIVPAGRNSQSAGSIETVVSIEIIPASACASGSGR